MFAGIGLIHAKIWGRMDCGLDTCPAKGRSFEVTPLRILSPSEQVADHLKAELLRGRWTTSIPGVPSLAAEMGVNRKTVDAALRQLDAEGILIPRGAGRKRLVGALPDDMTPAPLRLGILTYEAADKRIDYVVEIQHMLMEAGHAPFFAAKSLMELSIDVERVAHLVSSTEADAWLVMSASTDVLDWFATQPLPVFSLFGGARDPRFAGAGPNKLEAYREIVRVLVRLGHRRIVLLARKQRRKPVPGESERTFLEALEEEGISVGEYHLPDWSDSKESFFACLNSLFHITPPTALIIQEATLFTAAQQFLARRGLRVPEDVSLICTDPDPNFAWCEPTIAHIRWRSRPFVRRVIRWADKVSRGKEDFVKSHAKAEFINGGTVGPAKGWEPKEGR